MFNPTPPEIAASFDRANTPAVPERKPWYRGVLMQLQAPSGCWLVAGLALVLAAPSLTIGLSTDDHVAHWNAQQAELPNPFTAFGFRPEPGLDRKSGYLAWWSSPQLKVQFLRPLSALSHADFHVWPNNAWSMHGINVLLYAALAALAWLLYRELLPGAQLTAALAALLFAVDDGHAQAVGWISSRNTVLSGLFALAALLVHVRARRQGSAARFQSAGLLALALLSGEGGIAGFAYLLAYEGTLETGIFRERVARLWPQLSVVTLWSLVYLGGHYGVHGSSFYRELSDPLFVLSAGLCDLPIWLAGLLFPGMIGSAIALPPISTSLIAAALVLPVCITLAVTVPRTRESRFFVLGAALCLPPLFTTVTQDRVLLLASFGMFGLLASFIDAAANAARRGVRILGGFMLVSHGLLAPLMFVPLLNTTRPIEMGSQAVVAALPKHPPPQVVLVNVPIELLTIYSYYILREQSDRTPPELLQQLYAGASELTVSRIDANTLELHAQHGWGAEPIERVFGNLRDMPRAGEVVQLDQIEVRILQSAADGRPTRVQFRFPSVLESPDRLWYVWQDREPRLWHPPQIGQHEVLAALDIFSSLPR